jgi:hypothetical protein
MRAIISATVITGEARMGPVAIAPQENEQVKVELTRFRTIHIPAR